MWICHKFCQIIEVPKDFRECHISCKIIYKTSWFQRQCAQWMLIIYSNLSKSIKYINQLYFFGFPSVFYSSHLQVLFEWLFVHLPQWHTWMPFYTPPCSWDEQSALAHQMLGKYHKRRVQQTLLLFCLSCFLCKSVLY